MRQREQLAVEAGDPELGPGPGPGRGRGRGLQRQGQGRELQRQGQGQERPDLRAPRLSAASSAAALARHLARRCALGSSPLPLRC